jgi:hypothetical protein
MSLRDVTMRVTVRLITKLTDTAGVLQGLPTTTHPDPRRLAQFCFPFVF